MGTPKPEDNAMHRSRANHSKGKFRNRANKTHRLNLAKPFRGGIRL